jgi:predicted ribosome-associated RNA-binding protein Tma20
MDSSLCSTSSLTKTEASSLTASIESEQSSAYGEKRQLEMCTLKPSRPQVPFVKQKHVYFEESAFIFPSIFIFHSWQKNKL